MTMYEDQGQNIINTLLGAKEKTVDFGKQQDKLNDSIKKMDAKPKELNFKSDAGFTSCTSASS